MNSSDQNPPPPLWLFILADLAFVGAAFVVAYAWRPWTPAALITIVGCLAAGAFSGLVPIVMRYERKKNELLDDRQREIEALARTVSSSAEQISIAANGLHEIAELAQKNLKQAEQLPHKLQDKIAEFQAQLSVAQDTEKEELERELLALRTTESERLESVSQRIAKSAAEWTKLEAATQQHLTAATDALGKLSLGTASAIGKAQVAAEQALAQARTEAARTLGEASGQGTKAIDTAKTAALAELDARFTSASREAGAKVAAEISDRLTAITQSLDEKIARLAAITAAHPETSGMVDTPAPTPVAIPPPPSPIVEPAASTPPETPSEPTAAAAPAAPVTPEPEPVAAPPKRPRRARREEPATTEAAPTPTAEAAPAEPPPISAAPEVSAEPPTAAAPVTVVADEPPPVVLERISEIMPVVPHTAEPFGHHPNGTAAAPTEPTEITAPAAATTTPDEADATKPARKRAAARKPELAAADTAAESESESESESEPNLGLGLDDSASTSAASVSERVITSDGATRLVVTAYIGIGNRLFIRGEGPGLSWDKGVPLQFVSIGKWRWETNDASGPVQFKLYKNDDLECAALGAQSLEPGHQQELTAAF